MIVRKFMQWASTASSVDRAEGAGSLARAYLYSNFQPHDRREAEVALTALLDDPAPIVRKTLAENFARSPNAPRSIVIALANDQSDISTPILSRSPLLGDGELIDCAAVGDAFAQAAIALRPSLSSSVSAALAEIGAREAVISLAVNRGADIPEFSLRRIVERFSADGEVRESILSRPSLPGSVRSDLVAATAKSLCAFVIDRSWLSREKAERVTREASDKAHVILASEAERQKDWRGARALVAHLRKYARLTPSLILRAALSGNSCLFEAALVELSGLPEQKVLPIARNWRGAGFQALYKSSGLPQKLLPVFKAALDARREMPLMASAKSANLSRVIIERVLYVCKQSGDDEDLNSLLALLYRFDSEAAREEAREAARYIFRPQIEAPPVVVAIDEARFGAAPRIITIDLEAIEAELIAA